jgi:hypothetical protein
MSAGGAFANSKMGKMKSIPRATITFDDASSVLSESNKESLRKLVQNAEDKGTISQVTVAAWSDKSLPRQDQELLDADRKLASERADAIENFLESEMDIADVDTYNMAESANWLAKTFNTRDAELKSVFGRTGSEMPVTKNEFKVIKRAGGPSKAVAVVEFESSRMAPEHAKPVTP